MHRHTAAVSVSSMDPSAPEFFLLAHRDRNFVLGLLEVAQCITGQGPLPGTIQRRHICKPARVSRDA